MSDNVCTGPDLQTYHRWAAERKRRASSCTVEADVGPVLTVTELWPRETDCVLCGAPTTLGLWLPMYEGKVLPDDYKGEWAGMPVCADCYAIHRPNAGIERPQKPQEGQSK